MRQALPIVAIVGPPNGGKSTLFNRLVGRPEAITDAAPGTTRDPVERIVESGGVTFWLVDTAGTTSSRGRDLPSFLAADIKTQIEEAKRAADVILLVVAADVPIGESDRRLAKTLLKTRKPLVLAVSKIDTTRNRLGADVVKLGIKSPIAVSAIHNRGIDELTAAIIKNLPQRPKVIETELPTLAIVGRPNVGKSSLFNALAGSPKALVSDSPGTTRDVNRAELKTNSGSLQLLDTAGIRRSGQRRDLEYFSWLRTTRAIAQADVALLVIDALEPATALDQRIAGLIKTAGRGLILAINKWDLVEDKDNSRMLIEAKLTQDFAYVWWAPLILISAKSGRNIQKIPELVELIIKQRQHKITTNQLNTWVSQTVALHPPAGISGVHPKLKYLTQTGTNPPRFSFFGRHLNSLHWSYKRYLEAQLRQSFGFSGTPIECYFKTEEKNLPRQVS